MRDSHEKVLLVDDEDMVLKSLTAFLELETSHEVISYTSAVQAIEHLSQQPVDLIISDFLMPEMNGLTFLERAKELHPDAPRILLTGYADKENAIRGINSVGLYQYIEKPWDNEDLRLIIRNALEKRRLMTRLQDKITEINVAYSELEKVQKEILKTFV